LRPKLKQMMHAKNFGFPISGFGFSLSGNSSVCSSI
jgi:hypothetical protein